METTEYTQRVASAPTRTLLVPASSSPGRGRPLGGVSWLGYRTGRLVNAALFALVKGGLCPEHGAVGIVGGEDATAQGMDQFSTHSGSRSWSPPV